MLTELARRENTENIKPNNDIDVYMKVRLLWHKGSDNEHLEMISHMYCVFISRVTTT